MSNETLVYFIWQRTSLGLFQIVGMSRGERKRGRWMERSCRVGDTVLS